MAARSDRKAKHPRIAAAIQEMQLQLLPALKDMEQVYAHGLATVIQLCSCEDSRIRLMAAERLMAEAKEQAEKRRELEAGRAARTGESHEEIMAQLRMLYAKALPEREPLVVEVSDGAADGQAGEAATENLAQVTGPLMEVAAGAEPARAEDEAPEPGEPAMVEDSPVQFRLERIPGFFPARFRRVPIEP